MTKWDMWKWNLLFVTFIVVLFVPLARYAGASIIEMGIIVGALLLGVLAIQVSEFLVRFRDEARECNIANELALEASLKRRRWHLRNVEVLSLHALRHFRELNERRVETSRARWFAIYDATIEFWIGDPDYNSEEIEDKANRMANLMLNDYSTN